MVYEMKLNEDPFNRIKNGTKKIEFRLYDEKRSKLNLNDFIIFHKIDDPSQTLKVKVTGLLRFNNFKDLFEFLGSNGNYSAEEVQEKVDRMHQIYSPEKENKYGVLGICIEPINE